MNRRELKKKNINNILKGYFFEAIAWPMIALFLPYYLMTKGLSILQIGTIFTIAIGISTLFYSLVFSKILKKIKLKTGLIASGIIGVIKNFLLFFWPTTAGATTSKFIQQMHGPTQSISIDVSLQHNLEKNKERKVSSKRAITSSIGMTIGIILILLIVNKVNFGVAFLAISIISLFSIPFYAKVNDNTRFKPKPKQKIPKINKKLKLTLLTDILYLLALGSSFSLVIAFLVKEKFSNSFNSFGLIFILLYLSMTVTIFITKKYLDKKNSTKTAMLGMAFLLVSALVIIISQNQNIILLSFIVEGIGAGIWTPSLSAMQYRFTEKENREKVSGYFSGISRGISSVGPLVGALLVSKINIVAPFVLKAILSIITIAIYIYIIKLEKN